MGNKEVDMKMQLGNEKLDMDKFNIGKVGRDMDLVCKKSGNRRER